MGFDSLGHKWDSIHWVTNGIRFIGSQMGFNSFSSLGHKWDSIHWVTNGIQLLLCMHCFLFTLERDRFYFVLKFCRGTTYNEEMLIKELDKNSVPYRIRPLHIGDFLWIAQDRSGNSSVVKLL